MDIAAWLSDLGLGHYAAAFGHNDVDLEVLRQLTGDDLVAIGVASVGHRRQILSAIAALNAGGAPVKTEAEHRQLTVLYCDMVGSTALSTQLDPEDMRDVIRAYHDACTKLVSGYGGYVANFIGDGLLVYFGWPRAHEDAAERAVRAGLALVDAVSALTTPTGQALAARVGIATGPVVVGDLIHQGPAQEQSAVGETPNLAARFQALAEPGQVVIGESTRRLLSADFSLTALSGQALGDPAELTAAFAVNGEDVNESRFEARSGKALLPMIGRTHELALLLEHWARARSGQGCGILLVGEAGMGKSRVVRAVLDAVAAQPHVRIRCQCSPYHTDSALWPVVRQLVYAAGLRGDDSSAAKLDKLEALLAQAEGGSRDETGLIAALLGIEHVADRSGTLELTPELQRARTLHALVEMVRRLAVQQPVLVVLEDAHWIDPTTLELLEGWLEHIASCRVLLLLTSRPEHQPRLAAHPQMTRLMLDRLGRADVEAIVARLGGDNFRAETIDAVAERCDGVPLFVEELTKALLETGDTSVPASLHDSLMARLDRVPQAKEIAQIAACIGREFDHALLAAVADRPDADLRAALEKLIAAELIFQHGRPPRVRYTFKHALVQDAAYESLLRSRRQQLHTRILQAVETERDKKTAEWLAHHAARAGFIDRAIGYWQQAGEAALLKSALHEAASHFGSAIELLDTREDTAQRREQEFVLQVQLGQALLATQGYSAASTRRVYDRAHALRGAARDETLRFSMFYGVWSGHYTRGEFLASLRYAEEFLAATRDASDDTGRLVACRLVGTSRLVLGQMVESREHLERAVALYDPVRHRALTARIGMDPGVAACCMLSWALSLLGFVEPSRALLRQASRMGEGTRHPSALACLHFLSATPCMCLRDAALFEHHAQALDAVASEYGLPMWKAVAAELFGWIALERGQYELSIVQFERGLAEVDRIGTRVITQFHMSGLSLALAKADRIDEGLLINQRAILECEQASQLWCSAELWRMRGDILLCGNRPDLAETARCFERAISIARHQQARLWELRAATSWARLLVDQGEPARARDLLSPVHAWFTEGFDAVDLVEARALLGKLT